MSSAARTTAKDLHTTYRDMYEDGSEMRRDVARMNADYRMCPIDPLLSASGTIVPLMTATSDHHSEDERGQ